MTQMPLWGEPEPPRPALARATFDSVVLRKYSGKQTTCHLCSMDTARDKIRFERDLASHEARVGEWTWLLCRNHARDVRSHPRTLADYMTTTERNDQ